MTPYYLKKTRCFRGTYRFHYQGQIVIQARIQLSTPPDSSGLLRVLLFHVFLGNGLLCHNCAALHNSKGRSPCVYVIERIFILFWSYVASFTAQIGAGGNGSDLQLGNFLFISLTEDPLSLPVAFSPRANYTD
jgi:hypothetical protein